MLVDALKKGAAKKNKVEVDPVYLCLLSECFGGGDLNGILYLMPQAYV